jgi:hypothetical protein
MLAPDPGCGAVVFGLRGWRLLAGLCFAYMPLMLLAARSTRRCEDW